MSASFGVGFGDLSIDVFLEDQNTRYSKILYLIDYTVYGLHFWSEINMCQEGTSLENA